MTAVSHSIDDGGIVDWLLASEARELDIEHWLPLLVDRLNSRGLALLRVTTGARTMHPEVYARSVEWHRDKGVTAADRPWSLQTERAFLDSPIAALNANPALREIRCDLERPDDVIEWPIGRDLKKAGATDYWIMRVGHSRGAHGVFSITTVKPGGFTDADRALIGRVMPAISIRIELESAYMATVSLLRTYLGDNAGARVMNGAFRRGTGEIIRAAVWMCDLRGFTARVDQNDINLVLTTLDAYFGCVADPVHRHGGEVLKFIGDAVLAIFRIENDPVDACRRAIESAREAFATVERVNAELHAKHIAPLQFGLALHVGDVMYGNIGASARLDFTVIGGVVNEASRVEAMCKELRCPLLLTGEFVQHASSLQLELVDLGEHTLRGVSHRVHLSTLPEFAPTSP